MAPCTASGASWEVSVARLDRADVLFVIDNGPTMEEEQALLEREIPKMVRALVEGETIDGRSLAPIGSLHAGVISADLGAGSDSSVPGCSALGDDGVMQRSTACGTSMSPFVWHFVGYHDPTKAGSMIACNAQLGAAGCSNAQPLEAVLKALLPTRRTESNPVLDRLEYRALRGHGRSENLGFLRDDPTLGSSSLLVVIITDKDDCSVARPELVATPGSRGAGCLDNMGLHTVERYVSAFQAIGEPDSVQFVIVAGIPPDLELAEGGRVGWASARERAAHYDVVLTDPRMQIAGGPGDVPAPSCEGGGARAHAPRRLLEFARQLSSTVRVASICRGNLSDLILDQLLSPYSNRLSAVCLPDRWALPENTECRVTWELLAERNPELPLSPVECSDQSDFLRTPDGDFPRTSERGRALCEVRRAPSTREPDGVMRFDGDGFYFDRPVWCSPSPDSTMDGDVHRACAATPWGVRAAQLHSQRVRSTVSCARRTHCARPSCVATAPTCRCPRHCLARVSRGATDHRYVRFTRLRT